MISKKEIFNVILWIAGLIMMPTCCYKGCNKCSEINIGRLRCGTDDIYDEEVIYLCKKHANKIRKLLMIGWGDLIMNIKGE